MFEELTLADRTGSLDGRVLVTTRCTSTETAVFIKSVFVALETDVCMV